MRIPRVVLVVALLFVVGCSDGSGSDQGTTVETTTPTSTTAAGAEAWPEPVVEGSTYVVPDDLGDARPGDVLAAAPLPPVDRLGDAARHRVLYASQDRDGRTVPVSGMVLVPGGTAPDG